MGHSSGMEFMAFEKAFTFLLGTGLVIKSFISDRHTSIAKWMREDCPKKCRDLGKPVVAHFFDIWHIGKSKEPLSHICVYQPTYVHSFCACNTLCVQICMQK